MALQINSAKLVGDVVLDDLRVGFAGQVIVGERQQL